MSHAINPRVVAHLATNHGLITPHQARDLGMSTPYIRAMLQKKLWLVLRRGVFVDAAAWHALDPWHGRPLLLARAALLAMRRGAVLSHDSAAHALEIDVLVGPDVPPAWVHITRPGDTNAWSKNGVKHHLARFGERSVLDVDGLRVLGHARTVIDMAREHGIRSGLVAADSALRQGHVTKNDLLNVVDGMASWPYITDGRWVAENGDGRSQTAIEALGREFVIGLGIGEPDVQWPLQRGDGRVAWCDLRVGCHVFELHGKLKVLPPSAGGVAEAPAADVLWADRKRERLVTAEGLGMTNLYFEDFFGHARDAARQRVLADYAQTVERYGTRLPAHLERAAAEIRARQAPPGARGA